MAWKTGLLNLIVKVAKVALQIGVQLVCRKHKIDPSTITIAQTNQSTTNNKA